MQPEPIETSTELSNSSLVEQSIETSQHGFQSLDVQLAGSANEQNTELARPQSSQTTGGTSPSNDGVRNRLERLNFPSPREDLPRVIVQRIAAYENASSPPPPKRHTEGPLFKVVKKSSTKMEGLRLEEFPNGCVLPIP
jgi:hypothetical protein